VDNTIIVAQMGIGIFVNGWTGGSITSNKISGPPVESSTGIEFQWVSNAYTPDGPISLQSNMITGMATGVDLNCNSNVTLGANTIGDTPVGVEYLPSGLTVSGNFFDVGMIDQLCGF
jgi:hypothetical protein